jgi:hypothetical protein
MYNPEGELAYGELSWGGAGWVVMRFATGTDPGGLRRPVCIEIYDPLTRAAGETDNLRRLKVYVPT